MAGCVNLEERFGKRHGISWEAAGATKSQWPREDWPCLTELRCRRGRIYPKGGEPLQAFTDKPQIAAKLRALACALTVKGHTESVITFHVDQISALLAVLRPYRRRQVSEAERERQSSILVR